MVVTVIMGIEQEERMFLTTGQPRGLKKQSAGNSRIQSSPFNSSVRHKTVMKHSFSRHQRFILPLYSCRDEKYQSQIVLNFVSCNLILMERIHEEIDFGITAMRRSDHTGLC